MVRIKTKKHKILEMLSKGYSVSYIAFRLKISNRYVRKVRSSIVPKTQTVPELKKSNAIKNIGNLRLHSNEYNIKILRSSPYYDNLKSLKVLVIKGMKVRLYNKSIEVYDTNSYIGHDLNDIFLNALESFMSVLRYLENDFHITLIKERYHNISHVKSHYSETTNEIAKDYLIREQKLQLKKSEDGKVWLLIDNSFNLEELETVHPSTAKQDMAAIKPMLESLRRYYEKNGEAIDFSMLLFAINEIAGSVLANSKLLESQGHILTSILKLINPDTDIQKPKQDYKKPDYIH